MRRTSNEPGLRRFEKPDPDGQRVTRIDRETLESVMRDDVFRAADGRLLALDHSVVWTHSRRSGRRT
jgi:hypothetical protein